MVWACLGASMPRRHHALVVMCGDEPHNSMDPPDETPQFDHGGGSKRRRMASSDPFMDAISSRTAHTPLAQPTARELPPDEDEEWDESQHLLTQPPSPPRFQPPSRSSPSDAEPPQPLSTTPPPPAPPIVPFEDIPANRKSIINRACSDVFTGDTTVPSDRNTLSLLQRRRLPLVDTSKQSKRSLKRISESCCDMVV
jgi:hypothetical protein